MISRQPRVLCNRGVVLSHGNIVADSDIDTAIDAYHAQIAAEKA